MSCFPCSWKRFISFPVLCTYPLSPFLHFVYPLMLISLIASCVCCQPCFLFLTFCSRRVTSDKEQVLFFSQWFFSFVTTDKRGRNPRLSISFLLNQTDRLKLEYGITDLVSALPKQTMSFRCLHEIDFERNINITCKNSCAWPLK